MEIVEDDKIAEKTGLKKAIEERCHGRVIGRSLGHNEDSKWDGTIVLTVFLMEMDRCDGQWHSHASGVGLMAVKRCGSW